MTKKEYKVKSLHITPYGNVYRLQIFKENSSIRGFFNSIKQAFNYALPLAQQDNAVIVIHNHNSVEHVYKF